MANENVKIVIKEVNETSSSGAGSSSDIVYVPGLAIDGAISKNIPVLCNSVNEFEYHFGDKPYELTAEDVKSSKNYNNYLAGSPDISYIYAKELLNAGLSVYYENICVDEDALGDEKEMLEDDLSAITSAEEKVTKAEEDIEKAVESLENAEKALTEAEAKQDTTAIDAAKADIALAEIAKSDAEKALSDATSALEELQKSIDKSAIQESINTIDGMLSMTKIDYLYAVLSDRLDVIKDKDEYTIKYITTGGYPTFYDYANHVNNTLADKLIEVAASRGDAVALVDHSNAPSLPLDPFNTHSIYYAVNKHNWVNGSFGAMFTPYGKYSCMTLADDTTTDNVNEALQTFPASFGYLKCLANAIKTSPNWLAMAGVTRGMVPNVQELTPKQLMSNIIAENYQPKFGDNDSNSISVNAITTIKPYGLTMWGNRTLERVPPKGTTALNFLNTRNMISDIKKLAHTTAKSLMFEQDSDALWLKFKSKVSPLLEQLKTGYGISDYKIVKATTKYDGEPLTKGELAAVIRIYPLYAVEYFDITVVISDDES